MSHTTKTYTADHTYAALKLIEALYRDGKISKRMYHNILHDKKYTIDTSLFL